MFWSQKRFLAAPKFVIKHDRRVEFKYNHVFIHLFHKDGDFQIGNYHKHFWLLSFQIEKSVIESTLSKEDNNCLMT